MAKRRTRKDKQKAKHNFSIKWEPGSAKLNFEADVNRQKTKVILSDKTEPKVKDIADISAKEFDLAKIKHNIAKSLVLSGLILISEAVIYFFLK